DALPANPWAICTPLRDGSNVALYVDGGLNREPLVVNKTIADPELAGYQKVVELLASIVESARIQNFQQRRNATLVPFIPRVLRNMDPTDLEKHLKPRVEPITVLFCDLRGSCKIASDGATSLKTTWEKVAEALDDIATTVTQSDGVVAGFQGDAVMAFWGWPLPQPDQIQRAIRAALRIRDRFDADGWWEDLRCGIGLAHGPAVVGKLGAHDLAKIDAFGPIPNLASRLESLTKRLGVRILVDEAIATNIIDLQGYQNACRTRRLARICPSGMTTPTLIHEVLPPLGSGGMSEPKREQWENLVDTFCAGDWLSVRQDLEDYFSQDAMAQLMMQIMDKNDNRLPPNWDGSITLDTK
ncbi:MAG: adenylate/guanylate cyclase domain-containing protein, partial [Gemmataceae bacterium]